MDAKQKADELIEKYVGIQSELEETTSFYWNYAIKCASIAVNEILIDLQESFEVAKELNPQAEGLIAGSIAIWTEVKNDLTNTN